MVTISLATEADLSEVFVLVKAAIAVMHADGIDQWDDIYPSFDQFKTDIVARHLYLAKTGLQLCGIIVLNDIEDPTYVASTWQYVGGPFLVVHRLAIDPCYTKKGIARQLMIHAEAIAKARRCEAIRLDTYSKNPKSQSLFKGLNYQKVGKVTFRDKWFYCYEKLIT